MNPSERAAQKIRRMAQEASTLWEGVTFTDAFEESVKLEVERAIEESRGQRWIPVEEKLPTLSHGGVGLCPCRFYVESTERQFSGYFDPLYKNWIIATEDSHTQHQVDEVTHWQPVPDPPKGNENV